MVSISQLIIGPDLEQWKIVRPFRAKLRKIGFGDNNLSNEWIIKCVEANRYFDLHIPVLELPVIDYISSEAFRMSMSFPNMYSKSKIICTTQS